MALDLLRDRENHFFTISDDGNTTPTVLLNDLALIGTSTQLSRSHGFKAIIVTSPATITMPDGPTVFSGWTVYIKNGNAAEDVPVSLPSNNLYIGDGSTSLRVPPDQTAMIVSAGNQPRWRPPLGFLLAWWR